MPVPIPVKSPLDLTFLRQGGADIQAEVQIWVKKDKYGPTDRPLHRLSFTNPLVAKEVQSVPLAPGPYVCVLLGMAREALSGVYAVELLCETTRVFAQQSDANTTPKAGDIVNYRAEFDIAVTA